MKHVANEAGRGLVPGHMVPEVFYMLRTHIRLFQMQNACLCFLSTHGCSLGDAPGAADGRPAGWHRALEHPRAPPPSGGQAG